MASKGERGRRKEKGGGEAQSAKGEGAKDAKEGMRTSKLEYRNPKYETNSNDQNTMFQTSLFRILDFADEMRDTRWGMGRQKGAVLYASRIANSSAICYTPGVWYRGDFGANRSKGHGSVAPSFGSPGCGGRERPSCRRVCLTSSILTANFRVCAG